MIKFPSIEQFRNVIKNVEHKARWAGYDENGEPKFNRDATLPTLKFRGTEKQHGTNAGIVLDMTDMSLTFQSRERELSITSDNAGFMLFMSSKTEVIMDMFDKILGVVKPSIAPSKIVVFGEWCGGSIQKGVALNQLEKMFVIFAVKLITDSDEEGWVDLDTVKHIFSAEDKIYNILNFPTWEIEIDFNKPHEAQNKLIDITMAVEAESPLGKTFGVSGIGEGVVYTCITPGYDSSGFWMKVKGEKHAASKVKTLAAVDVEAINSLNEFVASVVTESRLEQGLQNLVNEQQKPFEMKSMGDFIRWVHGDIMKEELDTIVANQFDPKKLGAPIATVARKWFTEKLNKEAGL